MNTRKALPITTVLLILALALATVGVGYGLWAETLRITGTVETGEVDVGFSGPVVTEWVEVDGEPEAEPAEKDAAAECSAVASRTSTGLDDGNNRIAVTVTGAYPSYHCGVYFDVSNLGTVPVKVHRPVSVAGNPAWVTIDGCYAQDTQLERGQSTTWCLILIHFDNEDEVNENDDYGFAFDVFAHQWNEEPGP